jgi:hypothetical protein
MTLNIECLTLYPVRNNAQLEFLTGFTFDTLRPNSDLGNCRCERSPAYRQAGKQFRLFE